MRFKRGMDVYTADEEKAGTVDRVVIDPQDQEVTHFVLQQGLLFPEERVVPISMVKTTDEEGVILRESAADLEDLPIFEETHYVRADLASRPEEEPAGKAAAVDVETAPSVFWYPPVGTPWWHPYGYYSYPGQVAPLIPPYIIAETERHIPEDTVPLEVGAPVIDAEGEHVGDVEQVFTESEADRATHLLISQGLLLKETKLVPTSWISEVEEDEVHLMVAASVLDQLPEYPEE